MYTKSKWYIDRKLTNHGALMIVSDNCWLGRKRPVAKVLYYSGSEDPEVQANAQLIAAAPDLLQAAKELTTALDDCPGAFNYPTYLEDNLRAAIKKAGSK